MGRLARLVLGLQNPEPVAAEKRAKGWAHQVRSVNDTAYIKELVAQLEQKALAPMSAGDHASMLQAVGRSNAFREILSQFKQDLATAERMISEDQARQRGRA